VAIQRESSMVGKQFQQKQGAAKAKRVWYVGCWCKWWVAVAASKLLLRHCAPPHPHSAIATHLFGSEGHLRRKHLSPTLS
jgi:hypothetical protein